MKALPIQLQIEVLESARASLIKYSKAYVQFGLCFHISTAIGLALQHREEEEYRLPYRILASYVPLFNLENAHQFSANLDAKNNYWWPLSHLKPRLEFLDWMIETLKEELK